MFTNLRFNNFEAIKAANSIGSRVTITATRGEICGAIIGIA